MTVESMPGIAAAIRRQALTEPLMQVILTQPSTGFALCAQPVLALKDNPSLAVNQMSIGGNHHVKAHAATLWQYKHRDVVREGRSERFSVELRVSFGA
jgi:hypothetical protein